MLMRKEGSRGGKQTRSQLGNCVESFNGKLISHICQSALPSEGLREELWPQDFTEGAVFLPSSPPEAS